VIRDKRRSETALDVSPSLRGSDAIWKMARLLGALRACGRPIEGSRQGSGGARASPNQLSFYYRIDIKRLIFKGL
jgi:hypothetical protein